MLDVSIYIPVYNLAKLLPRCLDSVVAQNLSNFECIIVNDGSTDNSLEVANGYKYAPDGTDLCPWLRIINLEKNLGIANVRTIAVKEAKGRFVSGLDADDTLPDGAIQALLDAAQENNYPDMVVGSANFIHENGKVELVGAPRYNQTGHDIMYELMTWRVHPVLWGTPWAKLIRREWLAQSDIIYRPGMQKYEDTECIVRNLPRIESFCSIDTPVYNYYLNDGSATARFRGERQLSDAKRLYISQCEAINSLFDGERREKLLDDVTRELSFTYLSMIYVLYRTPCINRYLVLKQICTSISEISPNWKIYFRRGNPRIIRASMALGLRTTHLMLGFASKIPGLRNKFRG